MTSPPAKSLADDCLGESVDLPKQLVRWLVEVERVLGYHDVTDVMGDWFGVALSVEEEAADGDRTCRRSCNNVSADIYGPDQCERCDEQMESITLRAGTEVERVGPERFAEVQELSALLAAPDRSVKIEIVELVPAIGIVSAETLAIFVGSAAGSGLIGAVVTDVYSIAKAWARDQFKRKSEATPNGRVLTQRLTVYGPDGKPTLHWEISYEGERERERTENEVEHQADDEPHD